MESIFIDLSYTVDEELPDYAQSAVTTNPNITWIQFVFTDDLPNGNKKRIRREEFSNIIKSGVHMPIKMQPGDPEGKHELSKPLGTITNLVERENKVLGLAALWHKEFPEDVGLLKDKHSQGEPLNLSWELFYEDSETAEDGIEDLKGTTVRGITFVGDPAYKGRTTAFSMSEQDEEKIMEDKEKIAELEQEVRDLKTKLGEITSDLESKVEELSTVSTARDELADWKSQREAEAARAQTLRERRDALKEAGVEFSDEEFTSREDRIAAMSDEEFEFYSQEVAAFSKKSQETSNDQSHSSSAPDVTKQRVSSDFDRLREKIAEDK